MDIWPDNIQALTLFQYMGTQWAHGFGGPVGLKYEVMQHKMGRMNLSAEDYEQLETDLRIMESAALKEMHKK